jgi:hypothetical protein
MAFTIARETYPTLSLAFSGLPATLLAGDIGPDKLVTFEVVVQEGVTDDLRLALANPQGFWADLQHSDYSFSVREAHLTADLPERDYGRRHLRILFAVRRVSITHMVRPQGQYPRDPNEHFNREVYRFTEDRSLHQRRKLEVEKAQADLDKKKAILAEHEEMLKGRKAHLVETGDPEMVAAAEKRGF